MIYIFYILVLIWVLLGLWGFKMVFKTFPKLDTDKYLRLIEIVALTLMFILSVITGPIGLLAWWLTMDEMKI